MGKTFKGNRSAWSDDEYVDPRWEREQAKNSRKRRKETRVVQEEESVENDTDRRERYK